MLTVDIPCDGPVREFLISERLKAGLGKAKAQGKHVVHPTLLVALQQRMLELCPQGLSMNRISQQLGIAYETVYKYVRKKTIIPLSGLLDDSFCCFFL